MSDDVVTEVKQFSQCPFCRNSIGGNSKDVFSAYGILWHQSCGVPQEVIEHFKDKTPVDKNTSVSIIDDDF